MRRTLPLGLALLATGMAPLAAQDDLLAEDQTVRRLRACLATGAPEAPRDSLLTAVVALRSLCYTQIRRLRDMRLRAVDRSFGLPEATLTAERQDALDQAREAAIFRLDDEVARAISNFTGLTS